MAITLKRTIWPVGHGAFYTEQWKDSTQNFYNVVYDCGAGNNTQCGKHSALAKCINTAFGKNEKINALYISHLHHDHINGVMKLIANRSVDAIYLPQLTPNRIVETVLFERIQSVSNATFDRRVAFLRSALSGLIRETRVVEVAEREGNSDDEPTDVLRDVYERMGEHDNIVVNIDKCTDGSILLDPMLVINDSRAETLLPWIYKPYNPIVKGTLQGTVLERLFNKRDDFEALIDFVRSKGIEYIKKIYEKIFDCDSNAYSMTLFSGFLHPQMHQLWYYSSKVHHAVGKIRFHANCLYMGDYMPNFANNMQDLQSYYRTQWKYIDILQVPHHGSIENYHDDLYQPAKDCFISSNIAKSYGHPDNQVLANIKSKGCPCQVVTENPLSKLQYYYRFI